MLFLGKKPLSRDELFRLIFLNEGLMIEPDSLLILKNTFNFLESFSEGKVIYGINTGLGPMAQYKVPQENLKELQLNLIRSHSCGSGGILDPLLSKAVIICRLNSLLLGYSGIHPDAVILLAELINREIYPLIPEHGGVGASGDLVQLAHVALAMLGEGEVSHKGVNFNADELFEKNNLKPMEIHIREGLALINGTSAMSGISMINLFRAENLLDWSVVASSMINEIVRSFGDHFSAGLNKVKKHRGQNIIAKMMRKTLKDSRLIRKRADHLYNGSNGDTAVFKDKVQEYYSVRCIPQILGPVFDTIEYAEKIVIDEINSVSDNPIVDVPGNDVHHGGNFHGDYISFEADKLKIAITKLTMLAERQINFLLNDKLNGILPPFINLGTLGLNFGLQGLQFTAVSTTAENQTLSYPMYLHSIPNNNDNQDIVSMGTNSALLAGKVIDNAYQVLAVEMIALAQAVDYLEISDKMSELTKKVYSKVRNVVPVFYDDRPKYNDITNVKQLMLNERLNLINLINI